MYAPGVLTGYGVKTLPAVGEAIEGGRWAEASQYSAITARVLSGYCDQLDAATRLLGRGTRPRGDRDVAGRDRCYFANSCAAMLWKDLNSSALPLGSRMKSVDCSPGVLAKRVHG